jgi:hypothetical protein
MCLRAAWKCTVGNELIGNTMPSKEILETEYDSTLETKFDRLISEFPYTTTLIICLRDWLRMNGDEEGAKMIEQTAIKYSRHEDEII